MLLRIISSLGMITLLHSWLMMDLVYFILQGPRMKVMPSKRKENKKRKRNKRVQRKRSKRRIRT